LLEPAGSALAILPGKIAFNWPPGKDVEKTKYVKVKFTYSHIPEGRGSTPEPEKGWGRRYRRLPPPPVPPTKSSNSAAAMPAATGSPSTATGAAPAVAALPSLAAASVLAPISVPAYAAAAVPTTAVVMAAAHAVEAEVLAKTPNTDAIPSSAVGSSDLPAAAAAAAATAEVAVAGAGEPVAADSKPRVDKPQKHPPKDVKSLDSLLKVYGEVEVFTLGDWWNARVDKIVVESRKSARVFVSYEQEPGIYANGEGDEVEHVIHQHDSVWVCANKIRTRDSLPGSLLPFAPVPIPALAAPSAAVYVPPPASAATYVPPVAVVVAAAPPPALVPSPVKRELVMAGNSGLVVASAASTSGSLVEGLHKNLASPPGVAHVKEESGKEDEKLYGHFTGHPCYWPLYWSRSKDTKLTFSRVKEYPRPYKRVRVKHGIEGQTANPLSVWVRDLDKERDERQQAGQASPAFDAGDSNKSSPVGATPHSSPLNNAPPVLSHSRAAEPSSHGVLLAPQVVRASSSNSVVDAASTGRSGDMGVADNEPLEAQAAEGKSSKRALTEQDRTASVSPVVLEGASEEQDAVHAAWKRKALHALALEDLTKAELKEKLGVKVPKHILKLLARPIKMDGDAEKEDKDKCKYKLNAHLWPQVEIDEWSEYTDDDRVVLRVRMSRVSENAGTAGASRSPANTHDSRSPVNKESSTDNGAKISTQAAAASVLTLRAAGSAGSAFGFVKAGQRAGSSSAVVSPQPPKASANGQTPANNDRPKKASEPDKEARDGAETGSKTRTSPVPGSDTGGKGRDAAIPRKRRRESSMEGEVHAKTPVQDEKRQKVSEAAALAQAAPPDAATAEKERECARDKDKERGRQVEKERDAAKSLPDSSLSPGLSFVCC